MDAIFVPLAAAVDASVDQIKLISCLLVAYPLGSVFIRIPSDSPSLRHLFNIFISSIFFLPILNLYSGFAELRADALATYFVAKYVQSKNMPWIVFCILMGHLTVNHILRVIYQMGSEAVEITGAQMVLVMKLTTFAWNVVDGRRPLEDLDKWQSAKRVITFPSIVEFFGYAFYFPGVLIGPALEFKDYMDMVHETLFRGQEELKGKRRHIPHGRKRVAYRKLLIGLAFLGLYVVFGGTHNFSATLTSDFEKMNWFHRFAIFQVYGTMERSKYYAVWTLTEGACILTGYGFTGFGSSGESLWTGATNVKFQKIEWGENWKVLIDSWNIKTNNWLREAVYKRVTPKGKKPGFKSSLLTYGTSAFWHGIAPGYYLTFISATFVTTTGRLARANIRPLLMGIPHSATKTAYDLIGTVCTVLLVNYFAAPFILLTVQGSFICWSRVGFYGHIMIGVALAFFYGGGVKYLRSLQVRHGIKPAKKVSTPTSEKPVVIPPNFDEILSPAEE